MSFEARSAEAFETLLARTGGFIVLLVDERLRITRAGDGAAQLAERAPGELIGLSLIAAFGSAALDAVAREALSTREPASGEAQLGALGSRHFSVDVVPIAEQSLVIALHDISALRRVERVRRDFVANISHELRTPLASIKLLAETLSGGAALDADIAASFATQIGREVDHLAQLVDELLELSMIESGETKLTVETLEPDVVVATLAERIGPVAARRGVRVRASAAPPGADGARALADPARLGQALLNLAHNAVKYSRGDGEVRLGWLPMPGFVRFTVADDGIGIPEAHQARIFERFYKVDRSRTRGEADELLGGGSAGLGLAIVRHIAEAHGGSVGVESTEGIGSTFWVDVPRSA
ncbi:MAG TPA: ATP-binding protein [Candidatus Saccharimonadales bacterium]|nr:ATP-binding protein [Candidatus Saccharimonadales bacterium]